MARLQPRTRTCHGAQQGYGRFGEPRRPSLLGAGTDTILAKVQRRGPGRSWRIAPDVPQWNERRLLTLLVTSAKVPQKIVLTAR